LIHNFSDNAMYIIPRWRGPDAQLKENFNVGWIGFQNSSLRIIEYQKLSRPDSYRVVAVQESASGGTEVKQ
jgi:hypothetical protein